MKAYLPNAIVYRAPLITGITYVVGVIGSTLLLLQGVKLLSEVTQRRSRQKDINEESENPAEINKIETRKLCCGCHINLDFEATTNVTCKNCCRTVCTGDLCSAWDTSSVYHEFKKYINNQGGHIPDGVFSRLEELINFLELSKNTSSSVKSINREEDTESEGNSSQKAFSEEDNTDDISGALKELPVIHLHVDPEDLPLYDHECPGVEQLQLKRLIQKIITEAARFPELFNQRGVVDTAKDQCVKIADTKKYDELVAAAVLNKVIESYRNSENFFTDSSSDTNLTSENTQHGGHHFNIDELPQYEDEQNDVPINFNEFIRAHRTPIPVLSHLNSDDGLFTTDDMSSGSGSTEATWEYNWLFKKKVRRSDANPIAMLVPSPTEEVKTFIGDKDVDEVSDLSEAEDLEPNELAEDEEENNCTIRELPSILIESKTLIGGKNGFIFDDNSSGCESLVSNPDSGINVTDARNDVLVDEDIFFRLKSENTVEAINQIKDLPVAAPRKNSGDIAKVCSSGPDNIATGVPSVPEDEQQEHNNNMIPGSRAYREHQKWLNSTANIPNNPYSAEALEKRLSRSNNVIGRSSVDSSTKEPLSPVDSSEKTRELCEEEVVQPVPDQDQRQDNSACQNIRTWQQVLVGNADERSDCKRFGRDYYINDEPPASTSRNIPDQISSKDNYPEIDVSTDERHFEINEIVEEDNIYIAKPIFVEEDGHKDETGDNEILEKRNDGEDSYSNGSLNQPESLSISDDSETVCIYDIKKMETRFEKRIPATEFNLPEDSLKISNESEKDNLQLLTRLVIEEEIIPVLPSVKKLMLAFVPDDGWKKEQDYPPKAKNGEESYQKSKYNIDHRTSTISKKCHNPGYSITARNISKKFREELKQSSSVPDCSNSKDVYSSTQDGRVTPERPSSPKLIAGHLKDNIAFYENLKRKQ